MATLSVSGFPAAAHGTPNVPLALQTESPSPTASGSTSPTPSGSPSPTPSDSPTPPFDPKFRRVDLSVSRHRVRVGQRVVLSGEVQANRPECAVDKPVTIRRLIFGTNQYLTVAKRRTDRNGEFRVTERARWNSAFKAVAHRRGGCRREVSDPVVVRVRPRLGVRVDNPRPSRFTNFRVYGRLRPSHPSTNVVLQRRGRNRWVTVQRQELSPQSTYSFFPFASWRGERVFRVKWPKADRDHVTGVSRSITVRTTAS